MKIIRILIWIILIIFPITKSFGAPVTLVHTTQFNDGPSPGGIEFNKDGTKMFVVHNTKDTGDDYEAIYVYDLSTPFDSSESSRTYTGDSERCVLGDGTNGIDTHNSAVLYDLEFSSDGMKLFTTSRINGDGTNVDRVYRFDLTSPYDVSTCFYVMETTNLETDANINGSKAGTFDLSTPPDRSNEHRLQALEINDDGTKLFLAWMDVTNSNTRLLEYNLTTPYDITTLQLETNAGILIGQGTTTDVINPNGMRFSANGKRIFVVSHQSGGNQGVSQISLTNAYDTSSFVLDGKYSISGSNNQPRGIGFSASGLKMYIGSDPSGGYGTTRIYEYNLACPFTLFSSKCPSITENKDRTGMVSAQIEIAKRTIDHSTDTALNRLKWIRRNKDKQNLNNLNINFKFTDQRLASLTEAVKTSAAKKKAKDKEEDVFHWSEGSIAVGRIGDTSISSTKKIDTDAITFGVDKFTDENGIKGLAFRVGRNNVDIGNSGSNLDTDTFNITYYSTTPIEDDTKFLDTFIGVGGLRSDLLTVLDGKNLTANRKGKQIYGTIRIKDEIKKGNLTIIPSGRFDIGHTILGSYSEAGNGGIDVENQHIRTKKVRAGFAAVEDVLNEKYTLKRHGKIEYIMDLDRSSKFKYTYTGDNSVTFDDSISSEALHSINGEIGIDIVLQDNFSVFLIYERNQALGSGHTDKIHIAIGYLPNKETNYAFNIQGSDDLRSEYILSKTINDFELDFKIINEDPFDISDIKQAFFNLRKVF